MLVVLTHTLQFVRPPFSWVWARRKFFGTTRSLFHSLKKATGSLEDIIAIEDERGVRSTFFVAIAGGAGLEIADEAKKLAKQGWEFQLLYIPSPPDHIGSFRVQRDAFELNICSVHGVRILHPDVPSVIESVAQEAISYDTSFRSETFLKFDPVRLRQEIIELPIAFSDEDASLVLGLSGKALFDYVSAKLEGALEMEATMFLVDFRAETFSRNKEVYQSLLELAQQKGLRIGTCGQALREIKKGKLRLSLI